MLFSWNPCVHEHNLAGKEAKRAWQDKVKLLKFSVVNWLTWEESWKVSDDVGLMQTSCVSVIEAADVDRRRALDTSPETLRDNELHQNHFNAVSAVVAHVTYGCIPQVA